MTIHVTVSAHDPQGDEVAFTSDVPVVKVLMKGGDAYNEYDYGSGVLSDSGLICPVNSGGQIPTLSHAVFYFGAEVTTTEARTTTLGELTTTPTTAAEIQTGGGATSGIGTGAWALGIFALALAGGLGWTAIRPAFKRK